MVVASVHSSTENEAVEVGTCDCVWLGATSEKDGIWVNEDTSPFD